MARFVLALAIAAGAVLALLRVSQNPVAGPSAGPLPQTRLPAPGPRAMVRRLTKSPVYQYARREALNKSAATLEQLDLGTTRATQRGLYRVSIVQRPEPVTLHDFQSWVLRVESRDGRPVAGAVLDVSGGMPQHGHPLPTLPVARPGAAPGEYRVEGLQFSMPGWWEVSVYVAKDRREDTTTFNLILE